MSASKVSITNGRGSYYAFMRRRHLYLLALHTVLVVVLCTSCGGQGGEHLPDGAGLLEHSAVAMRSVLTTKVALTAEGDVSGLSIKSAEGQITRDGSAEGTASVDMGRQLLELTFVIIGDDLYLRGPTGGFRKLSASSAFLVYDPRLILNPDRGIAAVLAQGTNPKTEAREQVDGMDSYRVQAGFSEPSLAKLVPGFTQGRTAEVWIAADGFRLLQAQFPTEAGSLTFRFSDYDAPAHISPPS
jgi:lipoprotein LprG